MKTNKLPIKVRASSLINSISQKSKEVDRLTKRLLKIQNQCEHKSETNKKAELIHGVFFDCSECGARLYKGI